MEALDTSVPNTAKKRFELAESVVWEWDMSDLVTYAVDRLVEYYKEDDEKFQEDWENHFPETVRSEEDED